MKYTLDVVNADEYLEKIQESKMFSCKVSISGINVRYNAATTLIVNPKITLIKKSKTQIEINIVSGLLFPVIAIVFTVFFWAIGIIAIIYSRLNTALIILTFFMPLLLWILHIVFNRLINKQIIEELKKQIIHK